LRAARAFSIDGAAMRGAMRAGTVRARERGIAIVTVLLVVALAATLAASVVWRERLAVRDVENQRLASEALWVQRAVVSAARAQVRAQAAKATIIYDGQVWSIPVEARPLASFLPRDALALNSRLADATLTSRVEDAQARFNLLNLVTRGGPSAPFQASPNGVLAYRRLLSALGIDPALAQPTADYLLRAMKIGGAAEDRPMQWTSLRDLAYVPGYDAATIRTLAPYVTLLPDLAYVNANTASQPVLMAALPTLSELQAHRLVERRATAYYVSTAEVSLILWPMRAGGSLPDGAMLTVNSGYFIVHSRIRASGVDLRFETLIGRYGLGDNAWTTVLRVRRVME
jgi:general secretion pathway protein K